MSTDLDLDAALTRARVVELIHNLAVAPCNVNARNHTLAMAGVVSARDVPDLVAEIRRLRAAIPTREVGNPRVARVGELVDCEHCGTPTPLGCYCASDECRPRVEAAEAAHAEWMRNFDARGRA